MERKEKRRISLTFKLNVLILAISVLMAGGLVAIAYQVHSSRTDQYFKQATSQDAAAVAAFMDGDFLQELQEAIRTDEFIQMRAAAVEVQDEEMVRDWLKAHGLYERLDQTLKTLVTYQQNLGVAFIYLQSVSGNISVNLCDPSENLLYIGSEEISSEEFGEYQTNERIEPTVSTTVYGWLCSAYEPVTASDGEAVALVGVDIDMNTVMQERHAFLLNMLMFAGVLTIIFIVIGILLMRRMATGPLSMLSRASSGFASRENGCTKENVIDLPIHSRDEIGDLYQEIRSMQGRMVEYLQNLTRVTAEKERIGAELSIATKIQADMLPRIFPPFPDRNDLDIYATMSPAKEVGGDFYDFFLIDDHRIGMVMADVSGKGVPAALFMVIAKTLIKNRALMGGSPAEVLQYVNNQLCEGNDAELFVTVWFAILDLDTGKGVAANAGHEHPAIRRAGGEYELVMYRHSPAVAVMPGMRFREHEFELHPGDSLFVYTDGVTEATSAAPELFGNDRLLTALNEAPESDPKTLLETVRTHIDRFVGDAPQFDDITMLGMIYHGPENSGGVELTLPAEVENLNQVLALVEGELEKVNCPVKTQMQINIAVEEMFVNIANYAYKPGHGNATVRIKTDAEKREMEITLTDSGFPYDPLAKPDPDVTLSAEERKIGGLGIFMVKKSMDEVSYEYRDQQNIFRMKKRF